MDIYCDHHQDSDCDDDKLLLDDENTNTVESCSKCQKQSQNVNGYVKTALNPIEDDVGNGNLHSPLLINGQYSTFENMHTQDFHCHTNNLTTSDRRAWIKLVSVTLLCFFFMITELIGGYLAGSLAVMTDAAHLFSDLIGFLVSLVSIWIGKKSATRIMTFGYARAEVLGAFISVLAVWLLAGVFCFIAIGRLLRKNYDIDANTMLIIASIGVVINIFALFTMDINRKKYVCKY